MESHTEALSAQSLALNTLVGDVKPLAKAAFDLEARVGKSEDKIALLREATAVLSASLEHHTDWHDKHTRIDLS